MSLALQTPTAEPGQSSVLVADETMVGWTGARNAHITVLPKKPTDKAHPSEVHL
jgi:hypothetical protein